MGSTISLVILSAVYNELFGLTSPFLALDDTSLCGRPQIGVSGLNRSKIADEVGVHKSTISRELRRNKGQRGWRPKPAPNSSSSLYSYLGPTTSHEF